MFIFSLEYKTKYFFKLILILLTALFNLHPTSILLGILVVSIKKSDYKIFLNTLGILIIFSVAFFHDILTNEHHVATMTWADYGFGIYLDVINLKLNFQLNIFMDFSLY